MTRARDLGDFIADGAAPELVVDTTTLVVDSSNNRVGVGTASPSQALDVNGTGNFTAISIGGTAITATATELNIMDGVTATASELNIMDGVTATTAELNLLDGVTATTAELNYVDGVTSAIQTQLDAKAPTASPTFTGDVTLPDKIVHTGDTNTAIRFPTDDTVSFETAGSERFRIGSSGELGIGGATYGTAGQVLTSGGSGAAPTWAEAAGGGGTAFSAF